MKKKFIFITNADLKIGFGHLERCISLAKILKSYEYECYISGVKKKYIPDNIFKKIFEYSFFKKVNFKINIFKKNFEVDNSFLIVDTYKINTNIQLDLKKFNLRWLQFDNLKKKKIYADIILNANPIVKKKDYANIIDKKNQKQILLLGSSYYVLRDEFRKIHRCKKEYILISTGGGTKDKGMLLFALNILLKKFSSLKIIVILQQKDPREKKLNKLKKNNNKMIFVKNTKKISYYFSKSYISITSGGSLLNESLLFNLKRIIISTASNQVNQCKAWNKLNYIDYLGSIEEKEKISTKLKNKLNNVKKIKSKNYTNKEKLLNGKFRIVKKILYEINN